MDAPLAWVFCQAPTREGACGNPVALLFVHLTRRRGGRWCCRRHGGPGWRKGKG